MLQLFPLDLLSHFASLLDGLHHRVLVPEQCRGVQAGQDVCARTHIGWTLDKARSGIKCCSVKTRGLTQRRASAQASAQRTGDSALDGEAVGAVLAAQEQVLRRGGGRLDQLGGLWARRQVERLCSFLLRKQSEEDEGKQM